MGTSYGPLADMPCRDQAWREPPGGRGLSEPVRKTTLLCDNTNIDVDAK